MNRNHQQPVQKPPMEGMVFEQLQMPPPKLEESEVPKVIRKKKQQKPAVNIVEPPKAVVVATQPTPQLEVAPKTKKVKKVKKVVVEQVPLAAAIVKEEELPQIDTSSKAAAEQTVDQGEQSPQEEEEEEDGQMYVEEEEEEEEPEEEDVSEQMIDEEEEKDDDDDAEWEQDNEGKIVMVEPPKAKVQAMPVIQRPKKQAETTMPQVKFRKEFIPQRTHTQFKKPLREMKPEIVLKNFLRQRMMQQKQGRPRTMSTPSGRKMSIQGQQIPPPYKTKGDPRNTARTQMRDATASGIGRLATERAQRLH